MVHEFELGPNEMWVHCPSCTYREVREASAPPVFVYCKKDNYKKISCFSCHHDVSDLQEILEDVYDSEDEELKSAEKEFHRHFECIQLKKHIFFEIFSKFRSQILYLSFSFFLSQI